MYGYPNYQTGMYGATPQMQERLNQMEQAYQPMRVPPIRGRIVTGIEEARAAQISLDGTPSFFPSPAEGKVYEKSIDLNGMPIFKVYALSTTPKQVPVADTIAALESKVAELEQAVNMMRGETKNEPDATTGNASTVQ